MVSAESAVLVDCILFLASHAFVLLEEFAALEKICYGESDTDLVPNSHLQLIQQFLTQGDFVFLEGLNIRIQADPHSRLLGRIGNKYQPVSMPYLHRHDPSRRYASDDVIAPVPLFSPVEADERDPEGSSVGVGVDSTLFQYHVFVVVGRTDLGLEGRDESDVGGARHVAHEVKHEKVTELVRCVQEGDHEAEERSGDEDGLGQRYGG